MSATATATETEVNGETLRALAFAERFIATRGNATKAYLRVFPKASARTARTQAARMLKRPVVQEYLRAKLAELNVRLGSPPSPANQPPAESTLDPTNPTP